MRMTLVLNLDNQPEHRIVLQPNAIETSILLQHWLATEVAHIEENQPGDWDLADSNEFEDMVQEWTS